VCGGASRRTSLSKVDCLDSGHKRRHSTAATMMNGDKSWGAPARIANRRAGGPRNIATEELGSAEWNGRAWPVSDDKFIR
jgi:hypothetical protein